MNPSRSKSFQPAFEALESRLVPATFMVNTTDDTVAADLVTGIDANGNISLRSAIMAANSTVERDKIILPAGGYALTRSGAGEDQAATGDFDVLAKLKIVGAGADTTIIDANHLDRVFQVFGVPLKIAGVSLRNGLAAQGGGIFNDAGKVKLTNVVLTGNLALGTPGASPVSDGGDGLGGALFNASGSSLTLAGCVLSANRAVGGDGAAGNAGLINGGLAGDGVGGGIFNAPGATLAVTNCSLTGNAAMGGKGGAGSTLAALGSTGGSGGNGGDAAGGAVFNAGTATLTTVTFSWNQALGGAGGAGGNGFFRNTLAGGNGGLGGNGSEGLGGGFFNSRNASATLTDVAASGNEARGGNGGNGGNGGTGLGVTNGQGGAGGNGGTSLGGGFLDLGRRTFLEAIFAGNHAVASTGGMGGTGSTTGEAGSAGAASGDDLSTPPRQRR